MCHVPMKTLGAPGDFSGRSAEFRRLSVHHQRHGPFDLLPRSAAGQPAIVI